MCHNHKKYPSPSTQNTDLCPGSIDDPGRSPSRTILQLSSSDSQFKATPSTAAMFARHLVTISPHAVVVADRTTHKPKPRKSSTTIATQDTKNAQPNATKNDATVPNLAPVGRRGPAPPGQHARAARGLVRHGLRGAEEPGAAGRAALHGAGRPDGVAGRRDPSHGAPFDRLTHAEAAAFRPDKGCGCCGGMLAGCPLLVLPAEQVQSAGSPLGCEVLYSGARAEEAGVSSSPPSGVRCMILYSVSSADDYCNKICDLRFGRSCFYKPSLVDH
ncbi:hypothetical protein ON010_g315 [Phytophthora cinnamomi]|nr:hypothetical protein ON010_g315 [Phytophthora cinnamomi]